jgi:hypothetical protein
MKKSLLLALLLTAGLAQAQEPVKPTPTVASYIMSWEMQNDACKGGDQQACRFRDAELLAIESQGWCLSDTQQWQPSPCRPDADSAQLFIENHLQHACLMQVTTACEILKEKPGIDHAEHVEEFLDRYCRAGSKDDPDTVKACNIQDQVGEALNAHGLCWNDGSDAQGDKVAQGHWERCQAKP